MRNRAALLCSFLRRVSALASQTTPTATPAPLQEYRRRGLNPDDFLLTVEALRNIPVQQLAYLLGAVLGHATSRDGSMIYTASDRACGVLRDYCCLLVVLRLVPVACHDEGTSIQVRVCWAGSCAVHFWFSCRSATLCPAHAVPLPSCHPNRLAFWFL